MICFIRVDDRLIHGQVQTSWVSLSNAKNILVIDDGVYKDDVAKQVLNFAAPTGMKLKVLDVENGFEFWEKAIASKNNIMVLFKTITSVCRLAEKGVEFNEVMVGPSRYTEGSVEIIQSTYFTEEQIKSADRLHKLGVKIFFQHTPEQKKVYWENITIRKER